MFKYIFFDLDGTLTDSKEGILNCLKHSITKLGDEIPCEKKLLKFIGPPLLDSYMNFCGYSEQKARQAIEFYRQRYEPIGKFENTPVAGGVELCKRLKEKGYILALASSKPEHMCKDICDEYGFTPYLDTISGSHPGDDETKADVIRKAMSRLGLGESDRENILMVGDRKFDVLGAKACGIACIGVEFFGYAEPGELMNAGAIAVVNSCSALEDYILSH